MEANRGVAPLQKWATTTTTFSGYSTDATASPAALASPGGMVYAESSDPGPYEPGAAGAVGYERSPNAKEVKESPNKFAFPYEFGKGFVLARGSNGEVDFSAKGYIRYLNQLGLDHFYTDAFGRTTELDLRQDFELNRLQFILHGWLFDERFRYFWYAWTQNVSQGDPAQVVVGGNLSYKFSDALTATAGIFSLPSTRSTAQSFPNWLRIDHRSMADEYFRASYIQGVTGERRDYGYPAIQGGTRQQSQRPCSSKRKPDGSLPLYGLWHALLDADHR